MIERKREEREGAREKYCGSESDEIKKGEREKERERERKREREGERNEVVCSHTRTSYNHDFLTIFKKKNYNFIF